MHDNITEKDKRFEVKDAVCETANSCITQSPDRQPGDAETWPNSRANTQPNWHDITHITKAFVLCLMPEMRLYSQPMQNRC